ncbi:MAG: LPS assembly protein LptD [Phycisphaerales bacterium]
MLLSNHPASWLIRLTLLFAAVGAAPALARQAQAPSLDGRDFGGVNLPAQPQEAGVSVAGLRTWSWRVGPTTRLLVEGDVDVTVGPYRFVADRVVVWLEPVRVGGLDGEQVAFYFQDVRTPGGETTIAQSSDRLLVTALVYGGETTLRTDLLLQEEPNDGLIGQGERRLSRYLRTLVEAPAAAQPTDIDTIPPSATRVERLESASAGDGEPPPWDEDPALARWIEQDPRGLGPAERNEPIFADNATLTFYAPTIQTRPADGDRQAILLEGGAAVQYSPVDDAKPLLLRSDRAVVFLERTESRGMASYRVEDIEGVYFEGDVLATNGQYTMRGERVYYDIRNDRALVLEAVFSAYDAARGTQIYVRAEAIRQISERQWRADEVLVSNVAFAEPHFAIGARDVTITQTPGVVSEDAGEEGGLTADAGEGARHLIEARELSFLAGDLETLTLRNVSGEFKTRPLRRFSIESTDGAPLIKTEWDIYTLMGRDAPQGNDARLLLDAYFSRGPAAGVDFIWNARDARGSLLAYYIWDHGEDDLTSGAEIDHDGDHRGVVLAEQVWQLNREWTLFMEGSWISDETFIDAFFEEYAETRREFATGLYARQQAASNRAFALEARGTLNDFVANEYLLQSLGYQTEKLPEISYFIVGEELIDRTLYYNAEARAGRIELQFSEPLAREYGLDTRARARNGLGLAPNESPADRLRRAGVPESDIYRFDTRHELEAPLKLGALRVVPYLVGRFTAYDQDFDDYAPQNDESHRLFGAGGVRISTSMTRIDDSVRSRLFDLHRIRHIIEPSLHVWHGESTIDQSNLPVLDDEVESLADGSALSVGVRNTWQTMRGGEGRRRSVDFLVMDTRVLWSSDEVDVESPFGDFYDPRPELSRLGDFVENDIVWRLTDAFALTNNLLLNTDEGDMARLTIGGLVDHGYGFSTSVEYRDLDPIGDRRLRADARYELTRKYAASLYGSYNLVEDDIQNIGATIERRFPQWTAFMSISVDNITDDFSIGFSMRPVGFGGERRDRVFMSDSAIDAFRSADPAIGGRGSRLDRGPFFRD